MSGGSGSAQWICCSAVFDEQGCVTNLHLKHTLIRGPGIVWRASHSFKLSDSSRVQHLQQEKGAEMSHVGFGPFL